MNVTIITGNLGKLNEFNNIFEQLKLPVTFNSKQVDLIEIQAKTAEEVSLNKMKDLIQKNIIDLNKSYIVEDSALTEVDGLLPGPFIKFYDYGDGNGFMPLVNQFGGKSVVASAVITFYNNGDITQFTGQLTGSIVTNTDVDLPRGEHGFGWDNVFNVAESELSKLDDLDRSNKYHPCFTLAELSFEQKNKISQRRKAIDKLASHIKKLMT